MKPELSKKIKATHFPYPAETWPRPFVPTMVCLHHTASPPGVASDVQWWIADKQPVSTPLIIDRDGKIYQLYNTMRWAYTLGLKTANHRTIEVKTLSIEIDSWGALRKVGDKYYSWTRALVPATEVCILTTPHRGQLYFHKYTHEQIESVRMLLLYFNEKYNIPLTYVGDQNMFGLCKEAIAGTAKGIYSHCSFRADKSDIQPQPNMVEMLKALSQ